MVDLLTLTVVLGLAAREGYLWFTGQPRHVRLVNRRNRKVRNRG